MKAIWHSLTAERYFVFSAMLFLYTVCAFGQDVNKMENSVIARIIQYKVKPGYQEKFRKVLGDYVLRSITTESNVMAEAYYEQENTNTLWLIERWTDQTELNKFLRGIEFKAIETLAKESLINPPKVFNVEDLEPLSKQQWRKAAKTGDSPFTVMLFVDAKPGTQQTFKDLYNVAMPKFRSEAGVVTYQLSQMQKDVTKFVTYEKFRNDEAFRYHLDFRPIQPLIAYLETSIKNPPFQNGLHRLIEFSPLTRE
jgi:quinol monooxygenase YgiN